jgi:glutathione-specific gamma-glutamylcyclotransferase
MKTDPPKSPAAEPPTTNGWTGSGDFWVFGYGSLMWRPGFDYAKSAQALLRGYHREFCIYSQHHRGTKERPGLVLGLDRGGCCNGMAYRVQDNDVEAVIAYLDERELVTRAYVPKTLPVRIGHYRIPAYTYVVDRGHAQYAGHLETDAAATIIMDAEGVSGLNRDYLINTIRQLEKMGFTDKRLHALLARIEALTGEIDRGSGI